MSDEPTPDNSFDPSGRDGPEKKSADPPPEQVEKTPDEKSGRTRGWKTRANRIFPPLSPVPEDRLANPLPGIVLLLFFLGLAALSILLIRPPAPLPETAPADQFSAERALAHIEAIAAEPRPVGSPAHAEVQAYLIAQLKQLGLEPEVQKAVVVRDDGGRNAMVTNVENVLARLPGSQGGGDAILLCAHYDSVATGLGASDDGSGVATLLETARALKAGSGPLANDVIFLFTDGEEQGWVGATAFVEEHPWAKEVRVAVAFDPAISTGALYLDVVSSDGGWLISQLAEAAPYPVANSLLPEYRVQLNMKTSDFDAFQDAGYPSLLFGAPGSPPYYHTVLDNPANVDLGSLQHQGSYALSLAGQFGDLDLAVAHDGDAVYFNVLGSRFLAHYPRIWSYPLAALACLVCIGAVLFGLRRKHVSTRGVLLGALASLLVAVVLAVVGYLLWRLIVAVYPRYDPIHFEVGANTYNGLYYWLAFMALGMGLAALMHSGLRTRIRGAELASGALLLWLVLAVASTAAFPGASHVFTWPLLFSSVGLWGWFVLRRSRWSTPWRIAWLALFTVPAVLLVAPALYVAYSGLSIHQVWIPMAVLGVLVGLLALPLEIMARPRKSWLPALMGAVMVGFLVTGHLTSDYTPTRPARDGVYYALNADTGEASWLGLFVEEGGLDVYTEQFLGEDARAGDVRDIWPWATPEAYRASAPLTDLAAPAVEQLDATGPGVFRLHVVPAPGTWVISLWTVPDPSPVTYRVDDKAVETDGLLIYWAPPAEGFDVTVEASALDSLTLRVVNETLGMPTLPGFSYEPRPNWIIPDTGSTHQSTVVAKTFTFDQK